MTKLQRFVPEKIVFILEIIGFAALIFAIGLFLLLGGLFSLALDLWRILIRASRRFS